MLFRSALMTDASGSMCGITASHNRGGAYFKKKRTPTDPSTNRQNKAREAFDDAVQQWQSLTPAERQSWEDFAANTPQTGPIGNTLSLTGQQAYVKAAAPRNHLKSSSPTGSPGEDVTVPTSAPGEYNNGESPNTDPTSPLDVTPGTTTLTLDYNITFPEASHPAGFVAVYRGMPQNPTRNFYKGPYQLSGVVALDADEAALAISVESGPGGDDLCDYGLGDVGVSKIPFRIRAFYEDGRTSHALRAMHVPNVVV